MTQLLRVAVDLLFEASRRKWFLALFGAITVVLLLLGFFLQLDVVDGAISGSKLFGSVLFDDIVTTNRVFAALYQVVAYVSFYGGACFLAIACSDFAPELFSPGRIEHLLSLPVARWQLLFGTYLGVLTLSAASALYGATGLTVLVGLKTGLWNPNLLFSSAIALAGFVALYAVMLSSTLFVRSAAVSGLAAAVVLVVGILASFRDAIAAAIDPGIGRTLFSWLVLPFPRLGSLATVSAQVAAGGAIQWPVLARLTGGCVLFAAALLFVAQWRFENKDF